MTNAWVIHKPVPCGFTRSGLPIGLQISGPSAGEASSYRLPAHTSSSLIGTRVALAPV